MPINALSVPFKNVRKTASSTSLGEKAKNKFAATFYSQSKKENKKEQIKLQFEAKKYILFAFS